MDLQASTFLHDVFPLHEFLTKDRDQSDIFVTLTFAQSLDAKIAGKDGTQLILSARESMLMTHQLRSMHDAILIGIGTALNDDPQLNTRLLPAGTATPTPIILDSNLKLNANSKLLSNYRSQKGRQPLIFAKVRSNEDADADYHNRREQLENGGAKIYYIPGNDEFLSLSALMDILRNLEIRSLMVEGGSRIISSFLASGFVHSLIVTTAPRIVGTGVTYIAENHYVSSLVHAGTIKLGEDVVTVLNKQQAR